MPSESPQDPRGRDTQYATADVSAAPERIPEYVVPAPDRYGGVNFPYRGQQTHGVEPTDTAVGSPDDWEGGAVEIAYETPENEVVPVPVRIVSGAATEYRHFQTYQATVTDQPLMVVGQKLGRTTATVTVVGGAIVYLGPSSSVRDNNGFPIGLANLDPKFVTLGEAPVWAVCGSGLSATIAVHTEYATTE
jgi:hypothetical protein